jgi:hypothetical protein
MDSVSQLLLFAGLVPLLATIAVPNYKRFVTGARQMYRPGYKMHEYDRAKIKVYLSWVIGLTAFYTIYNLIVTRNSTEGWQYTGVEFMAAAAGLVTVILEKKQK